MDFLTLEQYLDVRGVAVDEGIFKDAENKSSRKDILNQIKLIARIHKILNEYPYGLSPSIKCKIGQELEGMKILYKKISKSFSMDYYPQNLREKAAQILVKAKNSIEYIKENDYLILFKRAMENEEIVLGNCGFKDLKHHNKINIKINSTKGISYNIYESDYGKFLVKLKRYRMIEFYDEIINAVMEAENFSSNSEIFLRAYIAFPHQSLNMLEKYKEGKIQCDEETFCYKFMKNYKSDCSIGL